jgi:hypothetical protein
VQSVTNKFYYKTEFPAGIGKVKPYPEDLQIIADTKNNIQNNLDLATFRCNTIYNGGKNSPSATIPNCPGTTPSGQPGALEYMIYFDYCWNGKEDSINDWQKNREENLKPPMNFWHSSQCPASHPVLLPALVTHIFYPIKPGENTSKWFFSSDVDPATGKLKGEPGHSAHADWFGAWNKKTNETWLANCSNVQEAECAFGLLGDPDTMPNAKALRLRKDYISGDQDPDSKIPVAKIYQEMCSLKKDIPAENGSMTAAYCRPGGHNH